MQLQPENTNDENVHKLPDYVNESNSVLPGKALSESALISMIEDGRKTGTITMETAHDIIRKNFHS